MKNKTTKEKLLVILKKNKAITIEAIMEHFTVSEAAIRKHLNELESQELIKKTAHKQKIGRPYYTYELTEKGHGQFPNQYEQLPVELLEDLEELHGVETVEILFEKRMKREKAHLLEELEGKELDEKVQQFAEIQNEAGYMLEVEKTPEGDYVLLNYNCPIANVANKYRQVCSNEMTILNRVFSEREVTAESFITNGSHVCKWVIKAPKKTGM